MCSFAISRQLLLGTHLHNALRVAGQTHHHQPSIHPSLSSIPATHPSPHPAGRCSAMHSATLSPWCTDLIYRGTNHGKAGIRSPLMEKKKKKKKAKCSSSPPPSLTQRRIRELPGEARGPFMRAAAVPAVPTHAHGADGPALPSAADLGGRCGSHCCSRGRLSPPPIPSPPLPGALNGIPAAGRGLPGRIPPLPALPPALYPLSPPPPPSGHGTR